MSDGATPMDYPVERVIPHANYSLDQKINDIALLRLKKIVEFNGKISVYFYKVFMITIFMSKVQGVPYLYNQ